MGRRIDFKNLAFWALCAWSAWIMAVHGQDGNSRIVFEPSSTPSGNAWRLRCDPKTGALLQGEDAGFSKVGGYSSSGSVSRCVLILTHSRIETDRLRAISFLESCSGWQYLPGAVTAVRQVALTDYNVAMRSIALRMMLSSNLPNRELTPTMLISTRYDGSPELRKAAATALQLTPMEWERFRVLGPDAR